MKPLSGDPMAAATLESLKSFLRIEPDDDSEDDVLSGILAASVEHVTKLTDLPNDNDAPPMQATAIHIHASSLYERRGELVSGNVKPYGLEALLTNIRPAEGLV